MNDLVATKVMPSATVEPTDDRPSIGSWWWVDSSGSSKRDSNEYDRPGKKWLACVVAVGSNYAKVEGVRLNWRISLDEFHTICTLATDYEEFIDSKLAEHKGNVRQLMGEIRKLCHQLGVPFAQALAEAESSSTALAAASGVADIKRYSKALVKAKEKTLPELFKKVEEQHAEMATWMKAELIPAKAELAQAEGVTEFIQAKIHTVELYAGLQEELQQVKDGGPATIDEKLYLMQRRHYMDEECLAKYEAGGMNFKQLKDFDKWLSRDENFARIFPHKRCIVAFRIRRNDKDYSDLSPFIAIDFRKEDKRTFLYIRNGAQLWRLETSIDFGTQLFPDRERHDLLGDEELWIKGDGSDMERLINGKQRAAKIERCKENRRAKARELWAWKRAGKPKGRWLDPEYSDNRYVDHDIDDDEGAPNGVYNRSGKPATWGSDLSTDAYEFKKLTPENVYYDDAMKAVLEAAAEHNRVAVVVQGLFDRSMCLHPHPPYRLWTMEGFEQAIELVYDDSKAITSGEAPSWSGYLEQLAKSIKVGSFTMGQAKLWRDQMNEKYGEYRYWPNTVGRGPNKIHQVAKLHRDGSFDFVFARDRMTPKWVPSERPGYLKASWPKIEVTWRTPKNAKLFCVDAYTPGDFHMFFDDPRTRADYLRWAPYLLSAEDWHKARRDEQAKPKKASEDDDSDEGHDGASLDGNDDDE